jgi:hypothetical protein
MNENKQCHFSRTDPFKNKMNRLVFALILLSLITGCVSEDAAKSDLSLRKGLAKKVLTDTNSTTAAIALAINELSNDDVPPSFWVALSNDTKYPEAVHSAFIYHLFRHYVHPGTTLNELAGVVGPARWIKAENVIEIINFSGAYPVRTSFGDDGYAIHVCSHDSPSKVVIYMIFGTKVEQSDLLKALAGVTSRTAARTVIKDIGIIPPRA